MCLGVSKSGSPAPRPMMSLPSAFSFAARAVTARVGEGLTRWTRRLSRLGTGRPCVGYGVRKRARILREPEPSAKGRSRQKLSKFKRFARQAGPTRHPALALFLGECTAQV